MNYDVSMTGDIYRPSNSAALVLMMLLYNKVRPTCLIKQKQRIDEYIVMEFGAI